MKQLVYVEEETLENQINKNTTKVSEAQVSVLRKDQLADGSVVEVFNSLNKMFDNDETDENNDVVLMMKQPKRGIKRKRNIEHQDSGETSYKQSDDKIMSRTEINVRIYDEALSKGGRFSCDQCNCKVQGV